jgi:hypothetical protein
MGGKRNGQAQERTFKRPFCETFADVKQFIGQGLKGYVAMSNPLPFIIPALIIVALLLVISISLGDK